MPYRRDLHDLQAGIDQVRRDRAEGHLCWRAAVYRVGHSVPGFDPNRLVESQCPTCGEQLKRNLRGGYCQVCDLSWKMRSGGRDHPGKMAVFMRAGEVLP